MLAAFLGHPDACRLLLAAGADVDARDAHGKTALHLAARAGKGSGASESAAPVLLEAGADVNDSGVEIFPIAASITPLMFTAIFNNAAELEVLLALRADPSLRGRFLTRRGTALDLAKHWRRAAAQALLEDA